MQLERLRALAVGLALTVATGVAVGLFAGGFVWLFHTQLR